MNAFQAIKSVFLKKRIKKSLKVILIATVLLESYVLGIFLGNKNTNRNYGINTASNKSPIAQPSAKVDSDISVRDQLANMVAQNTSTPNRESPSPTSSVMPTALAITASPKPVITPTVKATARPTSRPTALPTLVSTPKPTPLPTPLPTITPTVALPLTTPKPKSGLLSTSDPIWLATIAAIADQYESPTMISSSNGTVAFVNYLGDKLSYISQGSNSIWFYYIGDRISSASVIGGDTVWFYYIGNSLSSASVIGGATVWVNNIGDRVSYANIIGGDSVWFTFTGNVITGANIIGGESITFQ